MPKTLELLLTENVDNLGIVGDVVVVRSGYARNYLLPRGMATTPSEEMIQALATKRAEAEKELARVREMRKSMVERLDGFEVTLERSCNDQGLLYGSVTQKDIADALGEHDFEVKSREVRLPHTIKRIDSYEVLIRFDADLEATIKLWVVADRELDLDEEREEMEFDNEGNLIIRDEKRAPAGEAPAENEAAEASAEA
ncbi:MAG: 50S ribosomal protein L9 [Phycisphaerales bacterium]